MNRFLLPLFAAALLASGCANSTPAPTKAAAPAPEPSTASASAHEATQNSKAEEATAAIAAAEKSEAQAAASGFEWRDTGKLIQGAKKAAASNDFDKAITLAGEAERQGALAVKQAATQTERFKKMK